MRTAELKTTYQGEGRHQENQHLTREEKGTIPLIVAVQLPGKKKEDHKWHTENGERYFGNYPEKEWLEFVEYVKENGVPSPIFIVVEWVGGKPKAFIYEGNHRIQAAKQAGLDEIDVEVRYFGHAEEEFEWPRRHLDRVLGKYALVSTKSDLTRLIPKVESIVEGIAELIILFEAYTAFEEADDELAEELAGRINQLDPNHRYEQRSDVISDFHDEVYNLQKLIKPEMDKLIEWSDLFISRPEEARKFTLMRNNIKRIMSFIDMDDRKWEYLSPYDGDKVLKLLVNHTFKPLKYIHKYWRRLERYQKVEREIKHGPFTLVNEYGYSAEEYSGALHYLDEAAKRIRAKGFGEILYGKVVMTTERALRKFHHVRERDVVGLYQSLDDQILLAIDYDGAESNAVPVLIHEFGHRLWRAVLTSDQRKNHAEAFGWFSREIIDTMWDIIEESNYDIRAAVRKLKDRPVIVAEMRTRWRKAAAATAHYLGTTIKEMLKWFLGSGKSSKYELRDRFIKEFDEYVKPMVKTRTVSITPYGKQDPEEDFCDTFMYYCMGWRIPPHLEARFLGTLETNQ